MRAIFVVSDLTFPPREGLHQQTILLLAALSLYGVNCELHGYVKDVDALDEAALAEEYGIRFASPPMSVAGSSLLLGLRNRVRWGGPSENVRLRQKLLEATGDVVIHLEGIAAIGLVRPSYAARTIASIIDPGSRRRLRMAGEAASLADKAKNLIAASLYLAFESCVNQRDLLWHVVSESDASWLKRRESSRQVVAIPVIIPFIAQESLPPATPLDGEADPVTNIVIFADLRQPHMRRAFAQFIDEIARPVASSEPCRFQVLGRVAADQELRELLTGLDAKVIDWADDYVAVLDSADVIVLPDQVGTGLKNRAVQSMSRAKAVLGTPVAFEGLAVESGRNALVYRDSSEGQLLLRRVCGAPGLGDAIGVQARQMVSAVFQESVVLERWLAAYRSRDAS